MAVAAAPWGGLITSDTSEQSTCFSPGGYLISHHSLCERVCLTEALVETSRLVNNFPDCAVLLCSLDVRGQTWPDLPPPLTLCRAGALSCPIFPALWLPGEDSGIGRGPQGSTESLSSAAAVQAGTSADCLRVSDAS